MKIRVMGTEKECAKMIYTIRSVVPANKIRNISRLYPNRPPSTEYRLYLEIDE